MGLSLGDGSGEWHTEGRHQHSTSSLGSAKTTADASRRGTRGLMPLSRPLQPRQISGTQAGFQPRPHPQEAQGSRGTRLCPFHRRAAEASRAQPSLTGALANEGGLPTQPSAFQKT